MTWKERLVALFSFYSEDPDQREYSFVRAVSVLGSFVTPALLLLSWNKLADFDRTVIGLFFASFIVIFFLNRHVGAFRKIAIQSIYGLLYGITAYLLINAHLRGYTINSTYNFTIVFFMILLLMRKQMQVIAYSAVVMVALTVSVALVDQTDINKVFLLSLSLCYVVVSVLVMTYRLRLRERMEGDRDFMDTLFNNSFDGVFVVEYYSGQVKDCNAVAVRMFDVESKSAFLRLGKDAFRKNPPSEEEKRTMKLSLAQSGMWRSEIEYQTRTGRPFWGDLIVYPLTIRNSQYHVYRVVDISDRKKALQALMHQNAEYNSLINNMNEGMIKVDNHNRITFVNEKIVQMLGYSKRELIGQIAHELLLDEDAQNVAVMESNLQERQQQKSSKYNLHVLTKTGEKKWLEVLGIPLLDDSNEVVGSLGFLTDVTQTKKDQQALAQSEAKFRALTENAPVLIFKLDVNGLVKYVNWLGEDYRMDEVIDQPLTKWIEPVFRSLFEENLKAVYEEQHIIDFDLKASGAKRKSSWYSLRLAPMRGDDEHVVAIASDISKLKKFQEALSISEDTYREIFNTTSDLMYIQRRDGTFLDVNEAVLEFYGYSKADIIGKKPLDYADSERNDPEMIKRVTEDAWNGKPQEFTFYHRNRNTNEVSIKEVHLRKGIYFGEDVIIANTRDVTDRVRQEEQLASSEQKFRLLFSKANDAIFILEDGLLVECNERAFEVFEAEPKDFIGKPPTVLFPEKQPNGRNSAEMAQEYIDKALEGESQFFPWVHRKKNGTEFSTEVSLTVFTAEKRTYVQGIVRDITMRIEAEKREIRAELAEAAAEELQREVTERKRAEKRLQEEQRYARAIINSSLDMIIAADQDGRITEFNTAAQNAFGYVLEEVIGKQVAVLYSESVDRSSIFNQLLTEHGVYTGEIVNKRKNGEEFPSYISASILRDEEGNVIGSMGVSRDITEIKAAQIELKRREDHYRALYNQAYIGIARMSIDGRFVQANSRLCDILGYSEEELSEMTLSDITHPDYLKKTANIKRHFVNGVAEKITFEKKFIHKDGSEIDANLTIASVADENGRPDFFVTVFEDITEAKRAEAELKASLYEKEVLLKEVHHRVKNNLQVISSILNLQSSFVKDEGTLQILMESQNRIKSMSFIHENLYQTDDLSEIDFSDYVINLSKNLLHSYQVYDNKITLDLQVGKVMLNLDQAIPCGLVINEIVSNALKYAFPDNQQGAIHIHITEDDGLISMKLGDNGVGLPNGFNPDDSETLGLQLVTILTDQLSGELDVDLSAGTSYTLAFRKVSRNFKTGKFTEHGRD